MRVMVVPILAGAPGMVFRGLERLLEKLKINRRIETIQTTEYCEESWRPEKTLLLISHRKTTSLRWCEKLAKSKIMIIIIMIIMIINRRGKSTFDKFSFSYFDK